MKIIFCDIDGVLNSHLGAQKTGIVGIEEDKVLLLKELIDRTHSELVITSKARFISEMHEDRINTIERLGVKIRDTFKGGLSPNPKAIECLAYLQNKCEDFDNVLILDDNDDDFKVYFKYNFIKVNPVTGLTPEDVKNGIEILGED